MGGSARYRACGLLVWSRDARAFIKHCARTRHVNSDGHALDTPNITSMQPARMEKARKPEENKYDYRGDRRCGQAGVHRIVYVRIVAGRSKHGRIHDPVDSTRYARQQTIGAHASYRSLCDMREDEGTCLKKVRSPLCGAGRNNAARWPNRTDTAQGQARKRRQWRWREPSARLRSREGSSEFPAPPSRQGPEKNKCACQRLEGGRMSLR